MRYYNQNMPSTASSYKRIDGRSPYSYQVQSTQQRPNNDFKEQPERTPQTPLTAPVISNPAYLQGFLRTLLGKFMKVEFLIGTGTFIDKEGILEDVGVDHIVLREPGTNDLIVGDIYSIKFVEIPTDQ